MPIQVGDFVVEEIFEGTEAELRLSYVRVRKQVDVIYPEDEEGLGRIIRRFPEDKYEVEHWRISNGGQAHVNLYVRFNPVERRRRTNAIGRYIPVPRAEIEEVLGRP